MDLIHKETGQGQLKLVGAIKTFEKRKRQEV